MVVWNPGSSLGNYHQPKPHINEALDYFGKVHWNWGTCVQLKLQGEGFWAAGQRLQSGFSTVFHSGSYPPVKRIIAMERTRLEQEMRLQIWWSFHCRMFPIGILNSAGQMVVDLLVPISAEEPVIVCSSRVGDHATFFKWTISVIGLGALWFETSPFEEFLSDGLKQPTSQGYLRHAVTSFFRFCIGSSLEHRHSDSPLWYMYIYT